MSFKAHYERHFEDEEWFKEPLHKVVDLNPISAAWFTKEGSSSNAVDCCLDAEQVK